MNASSTMRIIVAVCLLATCLAAPHPDKRIVNGSPAALFAHPHQASIQVQSGSGWYHICGAVLIGRDRALTAGHCVQGQTASRMRVEFGALNLYEAPNPYEQTVGVRSFVIHPNYNSNAPGIPNDIAVIRLASQVTLNANVQIAGLAPRGSSFANSQCVITGWGQTSGTGSGSAVLLEASITKITTAECQSRWPGQNVSNNHICVYEAGSPSGSRPSACMGDSGGPMMCGPNKELLAGITSWGVSNCSGNYPSVYTRVSEYLDWVTAI